MNLPHVERRLRANEAFTQCYSPLDPRQPQLSAERIALEKQRKELIFGETNHAPDHRQP